MKIITASSARRFTRVLTARHGRPEGGDISSDMWGTYWNFTWRDRQGSTDVFVPEVRIYSLSIMENKEGKKSYRANMYPVQQSNWMVRD